jgi:Recombination directionality factor-like
MGFTKKRRIEMGNRLYGVTHDITTGEVMIRVPKVVKVSLGMSKGPDLHVRIAPDGKWIVRVGDGRTKALETKSFDTMEEAKAFYDSKRSTVATRVFPAKLPYFTFTRKGADENYEVDWQTTAAHGPSPTQLNIFLTSQEPFQFGMEMWGASELRCSGDGMDAQRLVTISKGYEEIAAKYEKAGERYFPIEKGCSAFGCEYAQADDDDKKGPCGAKGTLLFQLGNTPMIGMSCFLSTTGKTSIQQLNSCLATIKGLTGRGDPMRGTVVGIPLQLVIRPLQAKKNGKTIKFWAVHVEYRGAGAGMEIIEKLMEAGNQFHGQIPAALELPPGNEIKMPPAVDLGTEAQQAVDHNAEFTVDENDNDGDHILEDDISVSTPAPPKPPLTTVRQEISKSGQAQKKRSERIIALAQKGGIQSGLIVNHLDGKANGKLLKKESLLPAEHEAVEKALTELEGMGKDQLAALFAGGK